jgi:hypothetical protein
VGERKRDSWSICLARIERRRAVETSLIDWRKLEELSVAEIRARFGAIFKIVSQQIFRSAGEVGAAESRPTFCPRGHQPRGSLRESRSCWTWLLHMRSIVSTHLEADVVLLSTACLSKRPDSSREDQLRCCIAELLVWCRPGRRWSPV